MTNDLTPEAIAVLEKVKKLLALASNNDNEHQAAAASAKAMELLASYNLDMAMVGKTAKGSQRKDNKLKGGLYGWQRDLWKSVAELNFCMYWSVKGLAKGSTYEHRILGREENVIGAQIMAEYLQQAVERLTREYAKIEYPGQSIFIRDLIAYREGIAHRLSERLQALRWERQREEDRKAKEARENAPTGNGLVLADVINSEEDLNNDYLYGYEPGTFAQRRRDNEARRAAAQAKADEFLRQRDIFEAANPEAKAKRLAEEEALRIQSEKEDAEWYAKYQQRQARAEARPRKLTPAEERAKLATFQDGYYKGDEVGLDQQVGQQRRDRLA